MNPVLLKPTSSLGSQVIVNGRLWRNLASADYHDHTPFLRQAALDAYERLAGRFEYVVIEGAGSVAELNLASRDFVNLSMARAAQAAALLVSDIDRGGVFASIIGTLQLLEPADRGLIRAFAVNRFRGDRALFEDGVRIIEEKSGCPSLGVFPMLEGASPLDQEDSVSLDEAGASDAGAPVAILRFPRISNFTDFRLLRAAWISRPIERDFAWVILPGTKNTLGDLAWLRETGLDTWIARQHRHGARILGVCGGFQMLGRSIEDPQGMESGVASAAEGLGMLPVSTVLERGKVVRTVKARIAGIEAGGYEIHLGRTECDRAWPAFAELPDDGRTDGVVNERVMGTYLHGVLEHEPVARALFGDGALIPQPARPYDRLADWFVENADMRLFEERFL